MEFIFERLVQFYLPQVARLRVTDQIEHEKRRCVILFIS